MLICNLGFFVNLEFFGNFEYVPTESSAKNAIHDLQVELAQTKGAARGQTFDNEICLVAEGVMVSGTEETPASEALALQHR